jgi:hypothetical protein
MTTYKIRGSQGKITYSDGLITVEGVLTEQFAPSSIKYIAARPADLRFAFSGSGYPFANKEQAFDNTPTRGHLKVTGSAFRVTFETPNSYYTDFGRKIIVPTLFIMYKDLNGKEKVIEIVVDNQIPYRFLQYPEQRRDTTFYHAHHNLPVRSQEQVLIDSEYPVSKRMADDYWGLRPSM